MKKFLSLFIIVVLVLTCFSTVYAVGIDMDLNIDNSEISEVQTNETPNDTVVDTIEQDVLSSSTQKSSTTTTSEDFHLSTSDIINIILISVGVVLILLAISILIKIR